MIQYDSTEFDILDKKSGDRNRQQNILDYETKNQQQGLNQLKATLLPNHTTAVDNYNRATGQAFADYGDIMGRYRNFLDDPANSSFERVSGERIDPHSISYSRSPELASAMRGYQEFADTGGFDDAARRDIRARGISPIRAAYGNTMMELNRARGLGGDGGATNYTAALSRAQRDLPQQLADAEQNVNANLAQMIQQGQLSGLGGLSQTSIADTGFGQQAQLANQDAIMRSRLANQDVSLRAALANQGAGLQANQNKLGALAGMGSMYSATPGQASMFGNQLSQSYDNFVRAQQLQNQISQGKIQGQYQIGQMPTGFQSFLSNAGKIGQIAGAAAGIPFTGGSTTSNFLKIPNVTTGWPSTLPGQSVRFQ